MASGYEKSAVGEKRDMWTLGLGEMSQALAILLNCACEPGAGS